MINSIVKVKRTEDNGNRLRITFEKPIMSSSVFYNIFLMVIIFFIVLLFESNLIDEGTIVVLFFSLYSLESLFSGNFAVKYLTSLTVSPNTVRVIRNGGFPSIFNFSTIDELKIQVSFKNGFPIVRFSSVEFMLNSSKEMALLIDRIEEFLNVECYDSNRLADGTEVLKYRRKSNT